MLLRLAVCGCSWAALQLERLVVCICAWPTAAAVQILTGSVRDLHKRGDDETHQVHLQVVTYENMVKSDIMGRMFGAWASDACVLHIRTCAVPQIDMSHALGQFESLGLLVLVSWRHCCAYGSVACQLLNTGT